MQIAVSDENETNKKMHLFDTLIKNSELSQCKHELLSHYLQLEQYFMEESVNKAINMDILERSQQTSSMVDDTFFIIRKCIRYSFNFEQIKNIIDSVLKAFHFYG